MFGDVWNLLSALGGVKDIEKRLVLGELVISNRIINSAEWLLMISNYFDWLVKRYPDVSPTRSFARTQYPWKYRVHVLSQQNSQVMSSNSGISLPKSGKNVTEIL